MITRELTPEQYAIMIEYYDAADSCSQGIESLAYKMKEYRDKLWIVLHDFYPETIHGKEASSRIVVDHEKKTAKIEVYGVLKISHL